MKKNYLILLILAHCSKVLSGPIDVELVSNDGIYNNHGPRTEIPTVSTDGDDIIIKCDSTIYNVDVIISDQYGNVMHQSANTVGPTETVIHSHCNGDSEKTSIDLYYDDKHLKGYFE